MCSFPNMKPFQQQKIEMRLFYLVGGSTSFWSNRYVANSLITLTDIEIKWISEKKMDILNMRTSTLFLLRKELTHFVKVFFWMYKRSSRRARIRPFSKSRSSSDCFRYWYRSMVEQDRLRRLLQFTNISSSNDNNRAAPYSFVDSRVWPLLTWGHNTWLAHGLNWLMCWYFPVKNNGSGPTHTPILTESR